MLSEISSADNPKVKLIRKLASAKGRSKEGMFTAEGINTVSEMIGSGVGMEFIMIPDDYEPGPDPRYDRLTDYLSAPECKAYRLKRSIFDNITDAEHGIDVLAVAKIDRPEPASIKSPDSSSCILVCDRVQDPGNIGTMIRTAVAAGYAAILMMPGTADVYSPKVLRATAGMIFAIPIVYLKSEEELFKIASETSRRVVVTDVAAGSEYYNENLKERILLVIGNEASGVSKIIAERADLKVTLPMMGGTESLNAAVAAGILMYEAVRR